jgi:hypothetical protein
VTLELAAAVRHIRLEVVRLTPTRRTTSPRSGSRIDQLTAVGCTCIGIHSHAQAHSLQCLGAQGLRVPLSGEFTSEQVPWVSDSMPVQACKDTGESCGGHAAVSPASTSIQHTGVHFKRLIEPRGAGVVFRHPRAAGF